MSLLVTGSIGIDTVSTPFGVSENCIGGSAVYFSMAASFFTDVRFSGAIGADCPFDLLEVFKGRSVDFTGLENRANSKTFRWKGAYHNTMNEAITENLELNILAESPPDLPDEYRDSKFVFLANTSPILQMQLLEQLDKPVFVAADTMNCWIDRHVDDLKKLLTRIDALIINEDEARTLCQESNLIAAGEKILEMGPEVAIVKKGESGSIMFHKNEDMFVLPAYPSKMVKDPTGAGDSFAGALMGYAADKGSLDGSVMRKAIAYGTVMASFTISDFSLNGLLNVKREQIDERYEELKKLTCFQD